MLFSTQMAVVKIKINSLDGNHFFEKINDLNAYTINLLPFIFKIHPFMCNNQPFIYLQSVFSVCLQRPLNF